jgi:ABC-type glycerol-3-phosphate transport system substrate-binding protein
VSEDDAEDEAAESDDADEADDEPPFVSDLSGELHIYSPGMPESWFSLYIDRFRELHPNVEIVVEAPSDFWSVRDMSDQAALNTRLMAEPADIFIPPPGATFEKVVMGGLFADLNSFIHGSRGIDLDNYFANVFTAAEQQGGLYLVPIHVSPFDVIRILNLELFESIGIDAREFETINIDELLHYYSLIVEANPDRNIVMSDGFSILYLLMESPIHDVETLTVNVDTPEMAARFEQAMDMTIGRLVMFTPDFGGASVESMGVGFNTRFLARSDVVYHTSAAIFNDLGLFFGADHPNMRFTKVKRVSSDGYVRFQNSLLSMGIMRESPNQELAWEFIRFVLEFDESVLDPDDFFFDPIGYPN